MHNPLNPSLTNNRWSAPRYLWAGVPYHLTLAQFTAPQHTFLVGLLLSGGSVAVDGLAPMIWGVEVWRLKKLYDEAGG